MADAFNACHYSALAPSAGRLAAVDKYLAHVDAADAYVSFCSSSSSFAFFCLGADDATHKLYKSLHSERT